MVVDDEPDIQNLATMILKDSNYQVILASNGDDAVNMAESELPDLILLDIVLPEKNGFEVYKILKNKSNTAHIPIVMFSVLNRDVDKKFSMEAGADGHIIKPFSSEALLAEIREQIQKIQSTKFSTQIGIQHTELSGKKMLLEFEPMSHYERFIRDFILENSYHKKPNVILTKKGSVIEQFLNGYKCIEILPLNVNLMFTDILKKYPSEPFSIIYDNLTDVIFELNANTAYKIVRKGMELFSEPRITSIFLINPSAHEEQVIHSIRGLFSNQIQFGENGVSGTKLD